MKLRPAVRAARRLVPLCAWLAGVPGLRAQVPTTLGSIDVYRSRMLTVASLTRRHGPEIDSLVHAVTAGDMQAAIGWRDTLIARIRREADLAWISIGLTTSFAADHNTADFSFDVVDRADSAARLTFAPAPAGHEADPDDVLAAWQDYQDEAFRLIQSRELSPVSSGCPALHCVVGFEHPRLAPYLPVFNRAAADPAPLIRVLRNDSTPERRAAAVFVLAHMRDPARLVALIAPSLTDPSAQVRNNVLRVLWQIALRDSVPALPMERILARLDDPESDVRNKAAVTTAAAARLPEYRRIILQHGARLLDLLRLNQPNNHDPAWQALQTLSGRPFGERDYDAWDRWWAAQQPASPR